MITSKCLSNLNEYERYERKEKRIIISHCSYKSKYETKIERPSRGKFFKNSIVLCEAQGKRIMSMEIIFHSVVDGDDAARFGDNRIGYAGRRRHHVQQMEAIGKRRDTGR